MKPSGSSILFILSCLLGLLLSEAMLWVFAPIPDPFWRFKHPGGEARYIESQFPRNFRMVTEAEEGLSGVSGQNHFSTNNMGFRGDPLASPKPAGEFRVFIVGGSSAECLYLDDTRSIDAVLQTELARIAPSGTRMRVYNAGKSGDKSYDHLAMIAHRIVHLQPDMILLFAGVNDLRASLLNDDYLHFPAPGEEALRDALPSWKFIATEFQIPRRLFRLLRGPEERAILEGITMRSSYRKLAAATNALPLSGRRPEPDCTPYRINLLSAVGIARAQRIRLVFMTQQSTWDSPDDPGIAAWHWMTFIGQERYRPDDLSRALESYNEVMRTLGENEKVPVFDVARLFPKTRDFFYDDIHFNVNGARVAAQKLAEFIVSRHLLPGRGDAVGTPQ